MWIDFKSIRSRKKLNINLFKLLYCVYISHKVQRFLKPQTDWLKQNIGQMYITQEILDYLITLIRANKSTNTLTEFNHYAHSLAIGNILEIPKDIQVKALPKILEMLDKTPDYINTPKGTRTIETIVDEQLERKDQAQEFKSLVTAVHRNPQRYNIIVQYVYK